MEVHVVGVEEGLGSESLFDDAVGECKHHNGGPSPTSAAGNFADEQRAATVEGREHDEGWEHFDGQVAEKELGNQRSKEDKADGGGEAVTGLGLR
jgi:hypothetical protein